MRSSRSELGLIVVLHLRKKPLSKFFQFRNRNSSLCTNYRCFLEHCTSYLARLCLNLNCVSTKNSNISPNKSNTTAQTIKIRLPLLLFLSRGLAIMKSRPTPTPSHESETSAVSPLKAPDVLLHYQAPLKSCRTSVLIERHGHFRLGKTSIFMWILCLSMFAMHG